MRTALLICMLALAGLCNAQVELDANARQAVIERVLEQLRSDYVCPDTAEQAAEVPPDPPPVRMPIVDFDKVEIRATRISDSFYVLEGQGGKIIVLTGPDGVLMVDSQSARLTDKILAAIRQFSDQPIRFLINTHVHADHTGGNENLAKTGTLIFSRDQLRARLAHPSPGAFGRTSPPAPTQALPIVTYDAPVTLHVNGEDVQLIRSVRRTRTLGGFRGRVWVW